MNRESASTLQGMKILVLTLLLAGCGVETPEGFETASACDVPGATVYAEFEMDCAKMARQNQKANEMLLDLTGKAPPFATIFYWDRAGVIRVENGNRIAGLSQRTSRGYIIQLERSGWSLLHEKIHTIETFSNVDHIGWDASGYFAASNRFRSYINLDPSSRSQP